MANGEALVERAKGERHAGRLRECVRTDIVSCGCFDSAGELMRGRMRSGMRRRCRRGGWVMLRRTPGSLRCRGFTGNARLAGWLANTLRVAALAEECRGGHVAEARMFWEEARGLYEAEGIDVAVTECDEGEGVERRLAILMGKTERG